MKYPYKKTVLSKNIENKEGRLAIEFTGHRETDSEDSDEHFISPYNNIARFGNEATGRKSSKKGTPLRVRKKGDSISRRSKEVSTDEGVKVSTDDEDQEK